MTLNEILREIPEADRDLPVCLYTGWDGPQHVPAKLATVVDGEYIDEKSIGRTGRHILIEV